ncbi:MAG TPA: DHH family phosphoesterase [Verrucomicrobiae bacterium]|nr:DHH family phosphoesterase [Verrucomicrobiae bacterium]
MKDSFTAAVTLIEKATHIVVVQAENPDGDSLGSSLALEEILGDLGKTVSLYCPVDIPKYLRYAPGWDRVGIDFPYNADLTIIVDTSSKTLLEKALAPENLGHITAHPVLVIDHHTTKSDLPFAHTAITDVAAVATGETIYDLAANAGWHINPQAAEHIAMSILSDSLGLTTEGTTAKSVMAIAKVIELGASISNLENRRREFMKKSPEILAYKGRLLERIEYYLDGQLAIVHIPWEEISQYSDQYNPSMLVIDEMRLVEGVRLAIAIKTYPDGKLTAKIRANADAKVAESVAGFFGGGGHPYAAGFRAYEAYDTIVPELIGAVDKILKDYDSHAHSA